MKKYLSLLFFSSFAFAQFTQTPLPYDYKALEPSIDAQTMDIHYNRHHAGYVKNLNAALAGTGAESKPLVDIFSSMSKYSTAVRNNGGGHYNHEFFWSILTPKKDTRPSAELAKAITEAFGSMEAFKEQFNKAAASRFGSGWAWLSVDSKGKLFISSTPNQDNPLMDVVEERGTPVLGVDVWEHAYYLKYQNKRGDYLGAIWAVINWDEVSNKYKAASR